MLNPRVANRYAKALIDLAKENGKMNEVNEDAKLISSIVKSNKDFVQMLKSPIIKSDKKIAIIEAILSGKIDALTSNFLLLMAKKGREGVLPEIMQELQKEYNSIHKIHTVKLTTALQASNEVKAIIVKQIMDADVTIKDVVLEEIIDESIIGGYIVETADKLIDGSIANDLKQVKAQFLKNEFVANIR